MPHHISRGGLFSLPLGHTASLKCLCRIVREENPIKGAHDSPLAVSGRKFTVQANTLAPWTVQVGTCGLQRTCNTPCCLKWICVTGWTIMDMLTHGTEVCDSLLLLIIKMSSCHTDNVCAVAGSRSGKRAVISPQAYSL
jgi:hypothetical protein